MNSSITDTADTLSMATVVGGYFGITSGTILVLFVLYRGLSGLSGKRLVTDCSARNGEVGFAIRIVPSTPPIEAKSIQSESVSASGPGETPVVASVSLELQAVPKTS
jgi:hypothetical protein